MISWFASRSNSSRVLFFLGLIMGVILLFWGFFYCGVFHWFSPSEVVSFILPQEVPHCVVNEVVKEVAPVAEKVTPTTTPSMYQGLLLPGSILVLVAVVTFWLCMGAPGLGWGSGSSSVGVSSSVSVSSSSMVPISSPVGQPFGEYIISENTRIIYGSVGSAAKQAAAEQIHSKILEAAANEVVNVSSSSSLLSVRETFLGWVEGVEEIGSFTTVPEGSSQEVANRAINSLISQIKSEEVGEIGTAYYLEYLRLLSEARSELTGSALSRKEAVLHNTFTWLLAEIINSEVPVSKP